MQRACLHGSVDWLLVEIFFTEVIEDRSWICSRVVVSFRKDRGIDRDTHGEVHPLLVSIGSESRI